MEGKAVKKLIKWNDRKKKKPLIVFDNDQVDKTFIIKDIFAETFYKNNYIYINFENEKEINDLLAFSDIEDINKYFSMRIGKVITEETVALIIFDELQACYNAHNFLSLMACYCKKNRKVAVIATSPRVFKDIFRSHFGETNRIEM